ncbi:MAG: Exonuclease domain-containing protein [Lachnoclostridium sp.]|jgi:DNA polymerase III subunit epsilon
MNNTERITNFVCFDVETTGLSPVKDKIIEIGALKVKNGKIVEKFEEFINPQIELPERIVALTHITDDMLKNAETEEKVVGRFLDFVGDNIIMGHNIGFDYSFVKTAAVKCKRNFDNLGIDTLELSRVLLPDMESKSLESMCRHYNIINQNAHRAYDDAKATALLYVSLSNEFFSLKPEVFKPKPLYYKVRKINPITTKQKNYLLDLIKYHKIENIQSVDTLTQSEASRIIDKIILKKGRII